MMIEELSVREFLRQRHLAVVGASNDPKNFGNIIYRELRAHGYEVVPVNPNAVMVEGDRCYPDVVVRDCVLRDIKWVWLFKGVGGSGAVSDEALELCQQNGIHVVAGACPLMFLEPVAWIHRAHRAVRHLNCSLAKAS
jgi:predicted CoA-binding protein